MHAPLSIPRRATFWQAIKHSAHCTLNGHILQTHKYNQTHKIAPVSTIRIFALGSAPVVPSGRDSRTLLAAAPRASAPRTPKIDSGMAAASHPQPPVEVEDVTLSSGGAAAGGKEGMWSDCGCGNSMETRAVLRLRCEPRHVPVLAIVGD